MAKQPRLVLPTQKWLFVKDSDLREVLTEDYSELRRLVKTKTPKSAIVMFGAIMEALLVDALTRKADVAKSKYHELFLPKKALEDIKEPEEWKLYHMIRVATEIGLVSTGVGAKADIVRDYRNQIHPTAQAQKSYPANANTVQGVGSLFLEVVDSLASANAVLTWEKKSYLDALGGVISAEGVQVVDRIFQWANRHHFLDEWTKVNTYLPRLSRNGVDFTPVALRMDGKVQIRFGNLLHKPSPFRFSEHRLELWQRLNSLPGVTIRKDALNKYPTIRLKTLTQAPEAFIDILDWLANKITA